MRKRLVLAVMTAMVCVSVLLSGCGGEDIFFVEEAPQYFVEGSVYSFYDPMDYDVVFQIYAEDINTHDRFWHTNNLAEDAFFDPYRGKMDIYFFIPLPAGRYTLTVELYVGNVFVERKQYSIPQLNQYYYIPLQN